MKIKIEIELSIDDMNMIRNFESSISGVVNIILNKDKTKYENLSKMGIVSIDYMGNCKLTQFGNLILKQISRDDIIDRII